MGKSPRGAFVQISVMLELENLLLHEFGVPPVVVSPKQAKKAGAGNGSATKEQLYAKVAPLFSEEIVKLVRNMTDKEKHSISDAAAIGLAYAEGRDG